MQQNSAIDPSLEELESEWLCWDQCPYTNIVFLLQHNIHSTSGWNNWINYIELILVNEKYKSYIYTYMYVNT